MNTQDILTMRQDFKDRLLNGDEFDCPCCGRFSKIYRRCITSTMARQLIEFYKAGGAEDWTHTKVVVNNRSGAGDFSKLRYWGLIEKKPRDEDQQQKSNGYWQITHTGFEFLMNRVSLPKYAYVFDDTVINTSSHRTYLADTFDEHFIYREIMGNYYIPEVHHG